MANNTSSLCTMSWWMWRAKCSISARLALMTSGCLLSNAGMNLGILKISVLSKMQGLISYTTVLTTQSIRSPCSSVYTSR